MSGHLVLLGDSIIDNASYVPGRRPAVIDQVRSRLPEGWSATCSRGTGVSSTTSSAGNCPISRPTRATWH